MRCQAFLENARIHLDTHRFDPIEDINLFNILGMETKEVSAHSAFLFYVFRPFSKVDGTIDDYNLKTLYEFITNKNDSYPRKDEIEYISIQREYPFSDGRLDFLIKYFDGKKEDAIVIELKIWAGEQPYQIERYNRFLENNGYSQNHVYFLTPLRRQAETGDAINITLSDIADKVLKKIVDVRRIEKREKSDSYRLIIEQYIKTINKIIGENTMGGQNLIKSKNDIYVADKLIDERTGALNQMLISFLQNVRTEFNNILEKYNYPYMEYFNYQDDPEYIKSYFSAGRSGHPSIVLKLEREWFKPEIRNILDKEYNKEYYPCFCITIEGSYDLFAGFVIRSGEKSIDNLKIDSIIEKLNELNKDRQKNQYWMDNEYINATDNKRINFRNYSDNDKGFLRLFDEALSMKRNESEHIASNAFRIFEKQLKYFFDISK